MSNADVTTIADNLRQAFSDLVSVTKNLESTVTLIGVEPGFEDDVHVRNITNLLNVLTSQVSLESVRWNTLDDNRN